MYLSSFLVAVWSRFRVAGAILVMAGFVSFHAAAQKIDLVLPIYAESPSLHLFFHDLMREALEASGHEVIIRELIVPQKRAVLMLQHGGLSALWLVESKQRNEEYHAVPVGLTNGLIGKRILLIRPDEQKLFDQINDLSTLRESGFVAAMGQGWFDAQVWQLNQLAYREKSGNWKQIYDMLRLGREFDYFPRGLNEILVEARLHPELAVERKLVLIYERDFRFYLSKFGPAAGSAYARVITAALEEAGKRGLIDSLVSEYWGQDFSTLGYDSRTKIYLETPEL